MRKVRGVMAAGLVAAAWAVVGVTQAAPPDAAQQVWDDVGRAAKQGPVDVALLNQAMLHVPAGEVYVPQPQAERLIELMGNPGHDPNLQGLLMPRDPNANWIMPVRFDATGFIRDDDAKTWDVPRLLDAIRDDTEAQNEVRATLHEPQLDVVGWSEAPRYDAARQRLVWAIAAREVGAKPDAPQHVNYNTYALGREGYFSLNLVTTLADLPALKPVAERQIAALDYVPGKGYADFDAKTDRVSAGGLTALVVGNGPPRAGQRSVGALALRFAPWIVAALAVLGAAALLIVRRRKRPVPAFVATVSEPPALDLDLGDATPAATRSHGAT
jgi:uncharacterized membrane-anchored protein